MQILIKNKKYDRKTGHVEKKKLLLRLMMIKCILEKNYLYRISSVRNSGISVMENLSKPYYM